MMMRIFWIIVLGLPFYSSHCQIYDSLKTAEFGPVTITVQRTRNNVSPLDSISGTYIFTGKKSEVISVNNMDASITEKTGRQLFSKVPGIFVYDMEGGNQINISARGLDPHRAWEFNLRKDGIVINSDMYAYPASHYSIPMESVEKIELVRGTGALQYGAQFGGMLNYITKRGDKNSPLRFESFNTIGSYTLLSTYNAVGGTLNKVNYYVYFTKRTRGGFRENEHTDYDAQGIHFEYKPTATISVRLDWARSNYTYRIPGPLTDSMFLQNPRQATRSRNYYNPEINVPSLIFEWIANSKTKFQFYSSAILGQRRSVIYDRPATIADSINVLTQEFNNRQIDIDRFNSYTQEFRMLHDFLSNKSTLTTGAQLMNNHLHRTQLGKGTTGSDYDLTLLDPVWGRDLHLKSKNIAFFIENSLRLNKRMTLNAGARYEIGVSNMTGSIVYLTDNEIPVSIKRNFPILGVSISYKPQAGKELYGGISNCYRPVLFKDIIPGSVFERVDPNIKDASGYNAEIGFRGNHSFLKWDITGFQLRYNNRFGTLAMTDPNGDFYTYRTNTGNSVTNGIELFVQGNWSLSGRSQITVFTSTSLMDGRYTSGSLKSGNSNLELKDKKIESVPLLITRNGLSFQWTKLSATLLVSHTGETFSDPLNTLKPNTTGTIGLVPGYTIIDLNATFRVSRQFELKAALNNITDKPYFTKRPLFYPGPGIWPSDGQNGSLSLFFIL